MQMNIFKRKKPINPASDDIPFQYYDMKRKKPSELWLWIKFGHQEFRPSLKWSIGTLVIAGILSALAVWTPEGKRVSWGKSSL